MCCCQRFKRVSASCAPAIDALLAMRLLMLATASGNVLLTLATASNIVQGVRARNGSNAIVADAVLKTDALV
jgi:hypothetical protein